MYSVSLSSKRIAPQIRRWGSKTTNMFLPNEERYQFQGEKLTPEENRAAIPKKPDFNHLPKIHHEIIRPDNVADLLTYPGWNDIFVTALSRDSPFSGNQNHLLISKDGSLEPSPVNLYYTSTVCKWVEDFNKSILELTDLSEEDQPLQYTNRSLVNSIELIYKDAYNENFYLPENLVRFYKSSKAFKNSERKLSGQLQQSELAGLITVESLSTFLLYTEEVKSNAENFENLLSFIEHNIGSYSSEGLKELIGSLIDILHESKVTSVQMKLASFNRFLQKTILDMYPTLIHEIEPVHLDKLSFLLSISNNVSTAIDTLSLLILKYRISPSNETFNTFLSAYDRSLTNEDSKYKVLIDLADMKSVFFHKGATSVSFNFLLKNAVNNVYDLGQFLNFVERTNSSLFRKFSPEIFTKLKSIQFQSQDSNMIKVLQITKIIKKIVIDNKVELDGATIEVLETIPIYKDQVGLLNSLHH